MVRGKAVVVVFAAVVGVAIPAWLFLSDAREPQAAPAAGRPGLADAIGCLGRIEPGEGVYTLGARSLGGQPSIIARLLVAEGDAVSAGQVTAELDSAEQLRAAVLLADARIEMAREQVKQVEAGAKPSDIAAQQLEVDRIEAELADARKDLRREEGLLQGSSTTQASVDRARLRVDTLTRLRGQAEERLRSLSTVRPVDLAVARAGLEVAARDAARLRAEYQAALIRSPIDGRVITIHARPGEQVGPAGVMDVADTGQMYVLAEVTEGDWPRVRAGQRATISALGLPAALSGTVERVGLQVARQSVLKLDPAEFSDSRVAEARIRLDDGQRVAHLINLRVNVLIQATPSTAAGHQRP